MIFCAQQYAHFAYSMLFSVPSCNSGIICSLYNLELNILYLPNWHYTFTQCTYYFYHHTDAMLSSCPYTVMPVLCLITLWCYCFCVYYVYLCAVLCYAICNVFCVHIETTDSFKNIDSFSDKTSDCLYEQVTESFT